MRDAVSLHDQPRCSRLWHTVLYVYFIYVFMVGGSSQEYGWTDAVAQLLALPIVAISLWQLIKLPSSYVRTVGLVAILVLIMLPILQLLPLGGSLWSLAAARDNLGRDLHVAGVASPATTWSLTPAATLRAALSLLPAIALYLAALLTDRTTQRRLLNLCVALPIASLILAFLQLGAAQDSLLNPYPQWAPAMNGVFANPNHQGTAMLIGLGTCLAFAIGALWSRDEPTGNVRNPWPAVISGALLLLCLPLTNSRAAVVIGVLMLVAAPLAMLATSLRRSGHGRGPLVSLMFAAAVAALGLGVATGWMKVDELEEIRWIMRQATLALAQLHLPWGSGIGSFVPVFQQALPEDLLMRTYINAAHNDFAQVWLEGGVTALLAALAIVTSIGLALVHHVRDGCGDRRLIWATLLGLFALVAHSGADYPLRAPALLAVAGLLLGTLVAQGVASPLVGSADP